MRVIQGYGGSGDSDVPVGDSHEYATWDAAYVLGSLSPADRQAMVERVRNRSWWFRLFRRRPQ